MEREEQCGDGAKRAQKIAPMASQTCHFNRSPADSKNPSRRVGRLSSPKIRGFKKLLKGLPPDAANSPRVAARRDVVQCTKIRLMGRRSAPISGFCCGAANRSAAVQQAIPAQAGRRPWKGVRLMAAKGKPDETGMMTEGAAETAFATEASAKGIEHTVATLKDGMAQAAVGFEKTQARVKEGMEKAMRTAEDFVAFGQGNLEAVMKAGQIWAAGVQDIGKQVAATAQGSLEETMATFKALATVKSLKDVIDLQTGLARATIEKTLAESGKLTDASIKLTEQTMAPITARVSLAVEKFAKPV
ncbi:MAG: phasin family protein [Acetobacteraceae bacterium]